MSGKGNPPNPAPSRTLLTILDQAFVDPSTGKLTLWAGQFLIRLTGYIGPVPPPGSPGAGLTISQILSEMLNETEDLGLSGADAATQQAIAWLQSAAARVPPLPRPPAACCPDPLPPLAPIWLIGSGSGPGADVLQAENLDPLQTETGAFITL
jgi:hypothetical protein